MKEKNFIFFLFLAPFSTQREIREVESNCFEHLILLCHNNTRRARLSEGEKSIISIIYLYHNTSLSIYFDFKKYEKTLYNAKEYFLYI